MYSTGQMEMMREALHRRPLASSGCQGPGQLHPWGFHALNRGGDELPSWDPLIPMVAVSQPSLKV